MRTANAIDTPGPAFSCRAYGGVTCPGAARRNARGTGFRPARPARPDGALDLFGVKLPAAQNGNCGSRNRVRNPQSRQLACLAVFRAPLLAAALGLAVETLKKAAVFGRRGSGVAAGARAHLRGPAFRLKAVTHGAFVLVNLVVAIPLAVPGLILFLRALVRLSLLLLVPLTRITSLLIRVPRLALTRAAGRSRGPQAVGQVNGLIHTASRGLN
jgi:hypothetical protein